MQSSVYVSTPISQFIRPLFLPLGVHTLILYGCVSTSAAQIGSSVLFSQIPHMCVIYHICFSLAPRSFLMNILCLWRRHFFSFCSTVLHFLRKQPLPHQEELCPSFTGWMQWARTGQLGVTTLPPRGDGPPGETRDPCWPDRVSQGL